MSKILVLGESPVLTSGFANVLRRINSYFVEIGHEVEQLGWCQLNHTRNDFGYTIHPVNQNGGYYGQDVFDDLVGSFNPDIVFSLGDVYMVDWIPKTLTRDSFTWISYMPIDSAPIPRTWENAIKAVDFPVTYSKFGESVIKKQVPEVADKLRMIYHGIDTSVYYPEDKLEIRRRNSLPENQFIVLYVGTNSTRKQIPRLIEAFDIFARDKDDVAIFLHTSIVHDSGREGWFLPEVIRQYDIRDKIYVSRNSGPIGGSPESKVRTLYNLADIFATASQAEGFGLPLMEAAACKLPSIAANYSSMPELLSGRGELVEPSDWITHSPYGMKRPLVDVRAMARSMSKFYHTRKLIDELGDKAYEFAKTLDWEFVLPYFGELIENAMFEHNKQTVVDMKPLEVVVV